MEKYHFTSEQRSVLERLCQPFAVYQFINNHIVTILLSDGFCDLFDYADRDTAICSLDNNMFRDFHPEDLNRVLPLLTGENIMTEIEHRGCFSLNYRVMVNGCPVHAQLNAVTVEQEEGLRLIVGLNNIEFDVR